MYNPSEVSELNSPCLDITGVDRPVLTFDFVMQTEFAKDGIVLEYSTDSGLTWEALGDVDQGINWFNTPAFTTAPIGTSTYGWSFNSWELPDNKTNDLIATARRALDDIPDRSKVRFRLSFKSDSFDEREGLGISNIGIDTRSRLLLVENFTNIFDAQFGVNKNIYDGIDPTEGVKLQYHVNSPNTNNEIDPNSIINSADQSARAAYYGVTLTANNIPRAFIDGYSEGSLATAGGVISDWAKKELSRETLVPAKVDIVVNTVPSLSEGYLKVEATITALQNLRYNNNEKPVLHFALAEIVDAGGNEFVLREFFTSAAGTMVIDSTFKTAGQIIIETDSMLIEEGNFDSDMAVIAFIQDENNKTLYQAAVNLTPTLPTPVTAIEDPNYADKISFYPNPANQEVNIVLPGAVSKITPVLMFDTYGKAVYQNAFKAGEHRKSVNTTELAGGVYIIQLTTPDGGTIRKKVMVVH
jgi:hypothetical protein